MAAYAAKLARACTSQGPSHIFKGCLQAQLPRQLRLVQPANKGMYLVHKRSCGAATCQARALAAAQQSQDEFAGPRKCGTQSPHAPPACCHVLPQVHSLHNRLWKHSAQPPVSLRRCLQLIHRTTPQPHLCCASAAASSACQACPRGGALQLADGCVLQCVWVAEEVVCPVHESVTVQLRLLLQL